jgi:hypothetical protein
VVLASRTTAIITTATKGRKTRIIIKAHVILSGRPRIVCGNPHHLTVVTLIIEAECGVGRTRHEVRLKMARMLVCHTIGALIRFEYMLGMTARMCVRNAGGGEVNWTSVIIKAILGWARKDGTQLCYAGKNLRRGASVTTE